MKKTIWGLVIAIIVVLIVIINMRVPGDNQEAASGSSQPGDNVSLLMEHSYVNATYDYRDHYNLAGPNLGYARATAYNTFPNSTAVITELKIEMLSGAGMVSGAVNSVGITTASGYVTFPVVNFVAHITGLSIAVPYGNTGVSFPLDMIFNSISGGVASGTEVKGQVIYMKYNLSGGTYTKCYYQPNSCNYQITYAQRYGYTTPTYKLTGSIFTSGPTKRIQLSKPAGAQLANGVNKLADFTFDNNSTIFGQMRIKEVPITIKSTGTANIPASANNLKITSGSSSCSNGVNLIQNTSVTLPAGGTTTVQAVFPGNGVLIVPGTSVTFHVCVTNVAGANSTSPTSLSTTFGPSSTFKWQDVTGNNPNYFATENTQFLQGYPTNSSVVGNAASPIKPTE
jgi:hypothetical protein